MLKTTISSQVLGTRVLAANEADDVGGDDGLNDGSKHVEPKTRRSKSQKMSKSQNLAKSKKQLKSENSPKFDATKAGPSFLTPKARAAFNRLWLAFTKAPIFWYFNPECHIWIEIDASRYAIGGVLSQLASKTSLDRVVTKTNLGQWYLVTFFSKKMIPAETWYKTHDSKLLAIVKAFKM